MLNKNSEQFLYLDCNGEIYIFNKDDISSVESQGDELTIFLKSRSRSGLKQPVFYGTTHTIFLRQIEEQL